MISTGSIQRIEKSVEIRESQTYIRDRSRKNSVSPDARSLPSSEAKGQKRSLADLLPGEQNLWYAASVDFRHWTYDTAPVEIDTVSPPFRESSTGASRQKPSIANWVTDQNALGSASTVLEPNRPQTPEAKHITVDSPSPRVESFRKQRRGPYFKTQINANVYLSSKLGHLLLAGEPQKKGEELQIPVFHAFIGMEQPIGMLRADAHTFQMIDDPDVMSTLMRTMSKWANGQIGK
jgi:hypothetical protein